MENQKLGPRPEVELERIANSGKHPAPLTPDKAVIATVTMKVSDARSYDEFGVALRDFARVIGGKEVHVETKMGMVTLRITP